MTAKENILASGIAAADARAVRCRSCGGSDLTLEGVIPDARLFAGRQLAAPLAGGSLYRCRDCSFLFRYPIYSQATYDKLYREGGSETWDETDRIDHQLVRAMLLDHLDKGSVIDVGCGSGRLLMPLASRYATYGIEINEQAARIAQDRQVRVIAKDIGQIPLLERVFNAVVCCDVIEHLPDPLKFTRALLSAAASGGLVVISTANADAWSWRLVGSRFWYCYLPEHISFVSPDWFKRNAQALGVQVLAVKEYVYSPHFSVLGKALRLVLMALFRMSPVLYYKLLPKSRQRNIPVGRGITRDHFVIALRKL